MVVQENVVKWVIEEWGQLDVVIVNVGVGYFVFIEEMIVEQWNVVIDINLMGVFYMIKVFILEFKKIKGYLIIIVSLVGMNFFFFGFVYNVSKFGLVGFMQVVMFDL